MRYLTIIFYIFFLFWGCSEKSNEPLMGKKAAKFILGDDSSETIVWQLVKTFDPYNGGQTYMQDPGNPRYILLHQNGAFKEHDNVNVSFGNWYLNKEKNKLALVYYIQNGISIPTEKQIIDYRYRVKEVSKDSLRLEIQGRHGMVTQTYINSKVAPPKIRQNPWDDPVEIDLSDESIWKGADDDENPPIRRDVDVWDQEIKPDSLLKDNDSLRQRPQKNNP